MKDSIQIINRENMSEELDKIKLINPNVKFWSISRINNFDTCPRGYYYTYIDKKEQKTGIYSYLGSSCHTDLENLYENKTEVLEKTNFDNDWNMAEMFGVKFMSDNVRDNYKKDIDEHYKTYKKEDGEYLSEIGFILKLNEDNYMTGYIDLIQILEDNKIKIVDFKTSSKFVGQDKLRHAGRQLCVYQEAMRQLYGLETVENGWEMLKFISVKVGEYKSKDVSGREWVSKIKTQIKNLNKKEKCIDNELLDMLLSKCEVENSIKSLPKEIQDKIEIKTCFIPYEVTEEIKEETLNYILNNIEKIEKLDKENKKDWDCNVNSFYCNNLCSFGGKYCRHWEVNK